jgi:outer membrane protein assembly factor BamB
LTGDVDWQALLSPPSGRSDLDRLADVDGMISVVGQDVYAAGYQGRMAALAAESGQVLWSRELSTYAGLSADWTNVYSVLEGGEVIAMSRRTGTEVWRNESLLRREPTVPISYKSTVVVGDLEGYLHFFSNTTGEAVARIRSGKNPMTNPPVVVGERLYVQTDKGELTAYSIPEPTPRSAPDIAGDERD